MNADDFLVALDLPAGTKVERRVPKKLLLENSAPTAADKRHTNGGVEELLWLAALKPNTIGVPAYRDEVREYLEIAVLRMVLRPGAKAARLVELVHRAIPYPVLLLTDSGGTCLLSAAQKRWSQAQAGQTVLDDSVIEADADAGEHQAAFFEGLSLKRQPNASMLSLYNGWIHVIVALRAARVTGSFTLLRTHEKVEERITAFNEYTRLSTEIGRLRAAATREKQIPRQVDLNLEIKRLEAEQAAVYDKL